MNEEQKNFLEALKNLREEKNRRVKKIRLFLFLVEYLVMMGGLVIIAMQNFWIAVGIYLVLFSNNMGVFRILGKKGLKSFENLWKD